jgi:hypothetical protein
MSKVLSVSDERAEGGGSSVSYNWLHLPVSRLEKE